MPITLNISIIKLNQALSDKDTLDAFALAIAIKLKYSSSVIHKADIRNLKLKFGIGTEKASKAFKNALRLGYISEYENMFVANKVAAKYYGNTKLVFDCAITLKNVIRELKKLSILNHISVNNKVYSLKSTASNPSNLKEFKDAKAKISKWGINKFNTDGGLSYAAIAKVAKTSQRTAITLIKELVSEAKIKKQTFKLEVFNKFIENKGLNLRNVFEFNGITYHQRSNAYSPLQLLV